MAVTITATKPASQPGNPSWATNGGTRVAPTLGQKQSGWVDGQRPPFNLFNWLLGFLSDWAKYGEDATDQLDAGKLARNGSQTITGNLIPDADGTRDLGSVAVGFETLYAHDVVVSNELDSPNAFIDHLEVSEPAVTIGSRNRSVNVPVWPSFMGFFPALTPMPGPSGNGSWNVFTIASNSGATDVADGFATFAIPDVPAGAKITAISVSYDMLTGADAANINLKGSIATSLVHAGPTIDGASTSNTGALSLGNDKTALFTPPGGWVVPVGTNTLFFAMGFKHTGGGNFASSYAIHSIKVSYTQVEL